MIPKIYDGSTIYEHQGPGILACIRSCLLDGSETWAMMADLESKLERTKLRMIR